MDIKTSVVAILNDKNKIMGTGFVAGENLILTCAHVVEQATGGLNERVTIRFSDNTKVEATVDQPSFSPSYEKDVALLRVDSLPQGIAPLPLGNAAGSAGHDFYAYGYATVTDVQGIGARGKIVDIVDNGRLVQLTSQEPDHGMSGGPVLDEQRRVVIGMVTKGKGLVGEDKSQRNIFTTFATSTDIILNVCKELELSEIQLDEKLISLRKKFIKWSLNRNESFSIPNLNIYLPISQAWAQLSVISSNEKDNDRLAPPQLEKLIREYREWYESTHSRPDRNSFEVERIVYQNNRLVIIAGPGAGKSTLLRRLAWSLLEEGYLVVRVSLRTLALRLKKGESFDEALLATASDGFADKGYLLTELISCCEYLLADGLDEAGEMGLKISEDLKQWALARPSLKIVVTTRPVGYNPIWLSNWPHYELLSLEQKHVDNFVSTIFALWLEDEELTAKKSRVFSGKLEKSKIAKIAARNPLLLGFLLALFVNGKDLSGNRSRLFEKIIDDIRDQTRLDKEFTIKVEKSIANFVIEHLGFLLFDKPDASENYLEKEIGKSLEQQFDMTRLIASQKAMDALKFWEERGLIERLAIGSFSVFVFIHVAFQEFLAAQYLSELSDEALICWLNESYTISNCKEIILLLGGTDRLNIVVETLLKTEDIDDPVSLTTMLIAGILSESEHVPPNLFNKNLENFLKRITSNIPTIVDETVSALLPLAEIHSDLIGPIALNLSTHPNPYTVEVACILGLISGENYVNPDALTSIYLQSGEFLKLSNSPRLISARRPHFHILIIDGGKYLIKHNVSKFKEIVFKRYGKDLDFSVGTTAEFEALLQKVLSPEEFSKFIKTKWDSNFSYNLERMDEEHRAEWSLILTATITALQDYVNQKLPCPDKYLVSLSRLYNALDIWETPATDMLILLKIGLSDELIEIIRGAILVSEINPLQLRADSERVLSLLSDDRIRAFEVVSALALKADVDINWPLIKNHQLDLHLLLRALNHPVMFVCRVAAMLLLEYKDEPDVKSGLVNILSNASGYTIYFIAQIAQDIWGDQTGLIVLERLETSYTDECAPLIELLGSIITSQSLLDRATIVLHNSLDSKNVEIVNAAVKAIERLDLVESFLPSIKASYDWWFKISDQEPDKSGSIPANAANSLLVCLNSHQLLSLLEIKGAIKSKRSDVRDAAIKIIAELCTKNESLFKASLDEIERGDLSTQVLDELKKVHLSFCVSRIDDFIRLLDSKNLRVKISAIKIFGNRAMKTKIIEQKLRSMLESDQVEVRENVLRSLRNLNA